MWPFKYKRTVEEAYNSAVGMYSELMMSLFGDDWDGDISGLNRRFNEEVKDALRTGAVRY